MNFDDLQKKWGNQFPGGAEGAKSQAAVELLRQIQRHERRFRFVVITTALRDGICLIQSAWLLGAFVAHDGSFPIELIRNYKPLVLAGLVLAIVLTVLPIRLAPSRYPYSSSEGRAALSGRIGRDRSRLDRMLIWRDIREAVVGAMLLAYMVIGAVHAGQSAAANWIGVGLVVVACSCFLTYRIRTNAGKPRGDGTLVGTLACMIFELRRQVRLLDNLWWYITPLIVGLFFAGPKPLVDELTRGDRRKAALATAILAAAGWATWKLNRWAARSRLQPRLKQFEEMRSGLLADRGTGPR